VPKVDFKADVEFRRNIDVDQLATSHAATMRHHAPKLTVLVIYEGDDFDRTVQKHLQTTSESYVERRYFHE
jgi:hypothetical protein